VVTRSIPGSTDETNLQGKLDPASMQLVMRTSVTKYYSATPNQAPIFLHTKTSSRIFPTVGDDHGTGSAALRFFSHDFALPMHAAGPDHHTLKKTIFNSNTVHRSFENCNDII
jgi:hypothetical protein